MDAAAPEGLAGIGRDADIGNRTGSGATLQRMLLVDDVVEADIQSLAQRLILATFFVRFRDLGQVWEVLLQAGLYATPIIYPITFIADRNPWAAKLVMMNPLAQIIQDMRYFLIDKANTPVWLLVQNKYLVLIPYVLPILIFVAGFAYFNKHAKKFAEIL